MARIKHSTNITESTHKAREMLTDVALAGQLHDIGAADRNTKCMYNYKES